MFGKSQLEVEAKTTKYRREEDHGSWESIERLQLIILIVNIYVY